MELSKRALELSEEVTESMLLEANQAYHTNSLDILLAALAHTIHDWTKEEQALISLVTQGREKLFNALDISRTVGNFSSQYPVILTAHAQMDDTIKHTKDMLRRIPDQGRSYEIIKYQSNDELNRVEPEICFNYLWEWDKDAVEPAIEILSLDDMEYPSSNLACTYALNIEAKILAGQLTISIFYNEDDFYADTIEKLLATYQDHLIRMITYCAGKDDAELTITDITQENITMQELSQYKDELNNIKNIYPLAPMQEGMLYHALTDEQDTYIKLSSFQVEGQIDLDMLQQSFNIVVERHDILRTVFDYSSFHRNMQVVYKKRKAEVEYIDFQIHGAAAEAELEQLIKQYRMRRFDLSKDPLLRIVLVRMEVNTYSMIFHLHHILMDGWCNSLILIELFKIYNELKHGIEANLNPVVPYFTYIDWLKNKDISEAKAYWKSYLKGHEEITTIPFAKDNNLNEVINQEMVLVLDKKKTSCITRMAQESKITVNTVIQSIWAVLLSKYNNRNDIVYGYVVSGRNAEIEGVEVIPGLFINTLPLRVEFPEHINFQELTRHISNITLNNSKHDYLSLAEIQNQCEAKSDLISSLLVFENYPIDEKKLNEEILRSNDLKILNSVFVLPHHLIEGTNYSLTLVVNQDTDMSINFVYNEKVFSEESIAKISAAFDAIVDQIIANQHISIEDVEILDDRDKDRILYEFNHTGGDYPREKSIVQLFEEQAQRVPHHPALIWQNEHVTYQELNERANRLAHYLRKKGVRENILVGIMGERSMEMITGILGILKAGGAYVPMDPKYPVERMRTLLADSNTGLLLTRSTYIGELKHSLEKHIEMVLLDEITEDTTAESTENPQQVNSPSDLAYVMYTSGSTGNPKGVMIEHKSVVRLVKNTNYANFNGENRILQTGAMAFDASTFEIWGALLNGSSLVLVEEHILLHAESLGEEIRRHRITMMWLTSPLFNQLVQQDVGIFSGLETLIVGGDALSWEHINLVRKMYPSLQLINGYGPTENTTFSTYYAIEELFSNPIPIGRPISNSSAFIIDRHNHLLPIGVAGELCVAGDGLARGYLNNAELTDMKFVPHPYDVGARMYKTGDMARWLPDGNIEYLGRIDEQVKIRGFRIELNEIVHQLMLHEMVQDAIVVARAGEDGQAHLCAYIVSEAELSISALRNHVSASLPSYMIPSYFVRLEQLPLTPNGKVNRKALPEPHGEIDTGVQYVAPRDEMEQSIAVVWGKVLGIKNIGINDDFFSLGGDSIKAIQAIAQMRNQGYVFEIKDLMNNPKIKDLVVHIKQTQLIADQSEVSGEVQLTPIQQWFLEHDHINKDHFNQEILLFCRHGFREDRIEQAFDHIVRHHDLLRATYIDKKLINRKINNKLYDLRIYDLRGTDIADEYITDVCTQIQASMKLAKGPLVKLGLFKTDKGDYLLVSIHHMVVDTVSWRIIIEDFETLYNGQAQSLPLKTTSFQEWSSKQARYASGPAIRNELYYWNSLDQGGIKELSKDNIPQNIVGAEIATKTIVLDKTHTEKLLTKVNRAYSTEINDILLAALTVTIASYNQTDRILINLESHGRESIIEDVDVTRTVGWFTSQYPVVLHMKDTLSDLIKDTKDTLRRIPHKGIGYGILKYLSPFELKDTRTPDISFNYLGQFDENISGNSFILADIRPGDSVSKNSGRLYPLNISAMILHRQFTLTLSYIREEFKDTTIEELLQRYLDSLTQIIDHCVSLNHVETTAADLTDENISWSELAPYHMSIDNIQRMYTLTPMQEGLLFHSIADKDEYYHVNMELRVTGVLNEELFDQSFRELVARHDVLRTNFDSSNFKENMQIVYKSREAGITYRDIRDFQGDKEAYIEQLVREDRLQGFDLSKDILIRLAVVRMSDEEYSLILSNHHIILDGWSFGIISSELFNIYNHLLQNTVLEARKVRPIEDYIKWIGTQDKTAALNYWSTYLQGYNTTIEIPFKKSTVTHGQPQEVILSLNKEATRQIEVLAKNNNTTINTIFQSVWAILLQRYNNVSDVVFGFIVSGRTTRIDGIDEMVGLFINTIPLRVNTTQDKNYKNVLQKIRSDFNESEPYQYCSMAEVQKLTEVGTGLINGLMVFENYPVDQDTINKDLQEQMHLQISSTRIFEETNYSFNIKVIPGDELVVKFDYNDGVYAEEEVCKIKNHFLNILNQVISNPDLQIDEIEIVGSDERKEILIDFNNTYVSLPKEDTIQGIFEYQAAQNPEKVAVTCGEDRISYGEINKRANSIATLLRDKGVGIDSIVSIMIDRSIDMVVGVLAVLKAGAAYLPIDTNYPEERINYILQDSKAEIMLSTHKLVQSYALEIRDVIDLEDEELYALPNDEVININQSHDLAYVIYTSGTTGRPKGVMVEHKGVISLRHWFESDLGIGNDEHILQFASIAFDAFSWELFMAILLGNTLCIPSREMLLSSDLLNEYIRANQITTLTVPPFVAAELETENELRRVITAGSELKYEQISHLLGKVDVINAYGPTEDTVCTTTYRLQQDQQAKITIGAPINNHKVLILDTHNRLVPIGVNGELCIAGVGLARGYLNNEELTREKFIANPYQDEEVLYKTGDVARWLPDGNIEYLGRIDHQVKIRGYRIEIGEIELNLLQYPSISQVAIVDKDIGGAKYLCAYYVAEAEIAIHSLREFLGRKLPNYMIPAYFIRMESLPFNLNGKIDRNLLPEMDGLINTGILYEEADNETELLVIGICKNILGLKQLGARDNLFEAGGDSIRIAKIHKELKRNNIHISIKDIFYYENVRDICNNCLKKSDSAAESNTGGLKSAGSLSEWKESLTSQLHEFSDTIANYHKITRVYPITAIQKILLETNQTFSGTIMDFDDEVNVDLLSKSIASVVNEQGLLRSVLIQSEHQVMLQEHSLVHGLNIPYLDLSNASQEQNEQVHQYIYEMYAEHLENTDLYNKLLYKVILVKFSDSHYKLYLPISHLIFDAMSVEILHEQIQQAYDNQGELRKPNPLQYEHYVNEVVQGPQEISEQELIERFNLEQFQESFRTYFKKYKKASWTNTTISIPLTEEIRESVAEMSWEISMKVFLKVLELNFDLDTIPFALMYTGRKYQSHNYYHTVGAFIDILPLSLPRDQLADSEMINELITLASTKNINFAALLAHGEPKSKYKKVKQILKEIYGVGTINIPIFNYLGLYDSQSRMKEELNRIKDSHGSKVKNLSTEIAIGVQENELVIRLFCEENKLTWLTQELQYFIADFNKLILR